MPLKEILVFKLLLYRKAVYELISSDQFEDCFRALKKDTQSTLKEKCGVKYTKSFRNCEDELQYFELLEELLLFDETELETSIGKILVFFYEIINSNRRTYGAIEFLLKDIIKLKDGIARIQLSIICLSHASDAIPNPPIYSRDNTVQQQFSDSPQSNPQVKSHSSEPQVNFEPQVKLYSDEPPVKFHSGEPSVKSHSGEPQVNFEPQAKFYSGEPPVKFHSGEPQQHTLDMKTCYHINTTGKRGVCLIVNIYREYASEDIIPLKKIFTSLNYEVRDCDNITVEDYDKMVIKIKKLIEKLQSDSFIFIISSHGDQNNVKFGDGNKKSRDSIILSFQDEYCECLAGKPKLFFFQNCRGKEGLSENTASLEYLMADSDGPGSKEGGASKLLKRPKDILRFYASTDGNAAFRVSSGTIFLQTLCRTLKDPEMRCKKFGDFELELRRRVEDESETSLGRDNMVGVQITPTESTLTKIFYFAHPYL